MLVVICGPPCSGKSTLAAALAKETGFIHLEIDRIRERLIPGSDAREADRDLAYRCMHLIAEHLIRAGADVILDATYVRDLQRKAIKPRLVIQCKVSVQTALVRFRQRPPGHPAVDLTDEKVRALVEGFSDVRDAFIVNSEEEFSRQLRQLCELIGGIREIGG